MLGKLGVVADGKPILPQSVPNTAGPAPAETPQLSASNRVIIRLSWKARRPSGAISGARFTTRPPTSIGRLPGTSQTPCRRATSRIASTTAGATATMARSSAPASASPPTISMGAYSGISSRSACPAASATKRSSRAA
jgi:hypothetical protein